MIRQKICLIFLVLMFVGNHNLSAQKLEWNVEAYGFFDNSEGDGTYRTPMTYSGMRLSPEIGVSFDNRKHSLYAGYSGLTEWGVKDGYTDGDPILYYNYQTKPLSFLFGSFSRDKLLGDYPSYLISDSIRYYRPMIHGFAFQYHPDNGHLEVFLDWTKMRTNNHREQFMAGLSSRFNFGKLGFGTEGYYYHYALTWNADESQHIHDFLNFHPFLALKMGNVGALKNVDLKAGMLLSLDRERGGDGWSTPAGFLGEISVDWRRLHVEETVYAGGSQQHYGSSHFGEYYWGDTYYQAKFYSKTDTQYMFIKSKWVDASAGLIFNITKQGLNCHQMITLKAYFGSNK